MAEIHYIKKDDGGMFVSNIPMIDGGLSTAQLEVPSDDAEKAFTQEFIVTDVDEENGELVIEENQDFINTQAAEAEKKEAILVIKEKLETGDATLTDVKNALKLIL